MYPSVQDIYKQFTSEIEGYLRFMYLDVKGLVTTGYGNLIDPVDVALALRFELKDNPGTPATADQIRAEWNLVKGRTDMKMRGGAAYGQITKLQITDEALATLLLGQLNKFEAKLTTALPDFANFPADAQLGILSMAWSMGPAFTQMFPHFMAACKAGDWALASTQCKIDETGNPGVHKRNVRDVLLFKNASVVVAQGLDASALYYPRDLTDDGSRGASPDAGADTSA